MDVYHIREKLEDIRSSIHAYMREHPQLVKALETAAITLALTLPMLGYLPVLTATVLPYQDRERRE